jgi:hypothetical protein
MVMQLHRQDPLKYEINVHFLSLYLLILAATIRGEKEDIGGNVMKHIGSVMPQPAMHALGTALALAAVHQYLFYGHAFGVSVPLFTSLFYIYVYRFTKVQLSAAPNAAWLVLGAVFLLSLTYVLFDNPLFYRLNALAIPLLMLLHVTMLLGERGREWWTPAFASDALRHLLPYNLRQWGSALAMVRASAGGRMDSRRKHVLSRVGIGLAIAVPLLLIVVHLLASADGVFQHVLSGIPAKLSRLHAGEGFVRLLWIACFGLFLFGFLRGFWAASIQAQEGETSDVAESGAITGRFRMDPIIVVTVLVSVNTVYLLFVAVQFSYLFGAWEGLLPPGQTYAQYARSGFGELVAVSMINFLILIMALGWGEERGGLLERMNQAMLYVVVGCSAVMLYSAYIRLALYEEAYGYTYIRFLVHAFMIYLGVLMALAAVRIRYERISLAKAYLLVSMVAYVLINYAGMDRWIAANNLERYEANGVLDAAYLGGLSADAVPALIRFSTERYPLLEDQLLYKRIELSGSEREWPSFNASRHRALQALEAYFRED